jgi:hypothetical protein
MITPLVGRKAAVTIARPARPWLNRKEEPEEDPKARTQNGRVDPAVEQSVRINGSYFAAVGNGAGLSDSEFR